MLKIHKSRSLKGLAEKINKTYYKNEEKKERHNKLDKVRSREAPADKNFE